MRATTIRAAAAVLACIGLAAASGTTRAAGNVDLPRYPSISPDGSELVFTWRGDLWRVAAAGGHAHRVTSHGGDDIHSVWSRNGRRLAFSSNRSGHLNVYVADADGTNITHLTDIDRDCTPVDFGTDANGEPVVLFHSVLEGDVYREFRSYAISVDGGDFERLHDAFGSNPALSPDETRIAFVRGGYYDRGESRRHYRGAEASDVWVYDRRDGSFTQLTEWSGNDRRPRWGGPRTLLYLSDRELDTVNLYRMSATEGADTSVRLTSFEGRDVQWFDVSRDGETAVLSVWDTLYTLDLDDPDAKPVALTITASEDERDDYRMKTIDRDVTEAALSPDGKAMALVAYGEIYVRQVKEDGPTHRVTRSTARAKDIAWSPDGLRLYFTSDQDGSESIYAATVATTREEIAESFEESMSPKEEEAEEEEPENEADDDAADDDDAAEDDEEEGDDEEGDDEEGDEDPDDEDEADLPRELRPGRWQDAVAFTVKPVVQRASNDRMPSPSPDGRSLAFRGMRGDVWRLDLETQDLRRLIESWDAWVQWTWSPDGRSIAYAQSDLDFNRDIFIAPVDGSVPPVNITRHPDDDEDPRFSADGKILAFRSERINEQYDLWLVFLDKALEVLPPSELAEYFEEAGKAASKRKPLKVHAPDAEDDEEDEDGEEDDPGPFTHQSDLADAYLRVRRVTRGAGDEGNIEIGPSGERLVYTTGGPDAGLHTIEWNGDDVKSIGDAGTVQGLSLDGEQIVLVSDGQASLVPMGGGDRELIAISDRIRIDLQAQSSQKFLEAARGLGEGYYHPTMNGVDWSVSSAAYHQLAKSARTAEEFNWVANRFIGELNGSHLRISASDPQTPNRQTYGRLGTVHHRVADGFEITTVVPHGPADKGPMKLQPGDVVTAIEFEPLGPNDTVESALKGRIGRETIVTIRRDDPDGVAQSVEVLVTPVGYGAETQLKYEAWRRENARLVGEWSDGRIGYIHIQSMGQPALDVFERDLFAAAHGKDGLVIDVRNNGGGWTTDRVLSSIMVRPHAYTIPRGADPDATGHYPQPRLFIQRYSQPMSLLCNEKSYSNAEIMSHAFKTLGRGTLVGQQTHGSVISTGGWSLIDGTRVRLPFRGWFVSVDGKDMELNGAMPDLLVEQTPEAESRGVDEQMRAAVKELMGRLGD